MLQEVDYIVVGGGSSGCTIASRLSEHPQYQVALVEAGGEDHSPLIHCPMGLSVIIPTGLYQWGYRTTPQQHLNNRKGYQPRGKVIGGSSSINAMLYVRGAASDYDHWASLGNRGWDYQSVLPYFKKSENNCNYSDTFHGNDGPLSVENQATPSPLSELFIAACEQAGIIRNDDYNGAEFSGSHMYQRTALNGSRCSAAKAFITPQKHRSNLHLLTKSQTTRIIISQGRAVGIEYLKQGKLRQLFAKREVILSAGALCSPQLLMLSGLGPKEHLKDHNIEVIKDLPGVGHNLQDHIDYIASYRCDLPNYTHGFSIRGGWEFLKASYQWWKTKRGRASTSFAEAGAFYKSDESLDEADIQLIFVIAILERHGKKPMWGNGFSCHATLLRPRSRGTVKLASNSINDAPLVDPNFLADPQDLEDFVKGIKRMHKLFKTQLFTQLKMTPIQNIESTAQLIEDIKQRADTQYHPVGTCKMGPTHDTDAVVDERLKVHGIDALRVADASIMPTIISGNTNAPCIMIGEKAAYMILEDA